MIENKHTSQKIGLTKLRLVNRWAKRVGRKRIIEKPAVSVALHSECYTSRDGEEGRV